MRNALRREGDTLHLGGRALRPATATGASWWWGPARPGRPWPGAVEEILGDRVSDGLVNVKYGYTGTPPSARVRLREAGHPLPDESSLAGTREIVDLLRGAGADDLVLGLISGGGSALMMLPEEPISLEDYQRLTEALLRSGANINQINTIRKHIEQVKGGRLAQLAAPAEVATLILSDVVGDPLDFIASGPTVPDTTTFADALDVLRQFDLLAAGAAGRCWTGCERGQRGEVPETPKPGDPLFERVSTVVVGSLDVAAARRRRRRERRRVRDPAADHLPGRARPATPGCWPGPWPRSSSGAGGPSPRRPA